MLMKKRKLKIAIVTEGGSKIGFGHITRCLALGQAFRHKGVNPVFVINISGVAGDFFHGIKYKALNWVEEKKTFLKSICGFDLVIADSYLADKNLYKAVSDTVKHIVYIDDNNRLEYPKGIILNSSVYAEKLNLRKDKENTSLLGPKYMPLRKAFWDVSAKSARKEVRNILVTVGGSSTAKKSIFGIIKMLSSEFPKCRLTFILTENIMTAKVKKLVKEKGLNVYLNVPEHQMRRIITRQDLAVSAGGQTLYELACCGVPTVAFSLAKNQDNNLRGWEINGFIKICRIKGRAGLKDLKNKISLMMDKKTRQKSIKNAKRLIDGKGALRVAETLIKICEAEA